MSSPSFQRARSSESKQQRSEALVSAARSLAIRNGVASVTLTDITELAGVHHSAVRRYFTSHREILLRLAAEGMATWADTVHQRLENASRADASTIAQVLAEALASDPLFCDLLANVPLHLEHDVDVERVVDFKRTTHESLQSIVDDITHLTGFSEQEALDVVTAANAFAAILWQVSHPSEAVGSALRSDPSIAPTWAPDFEAQLLRLLTATCAGIAAAH